MSIQKTDTGSAVVSVGKAPIPWVFTPEQVELVDSRCRRLVVPHHCHALCTTKAGVLKDRSSCWRMVSKIRLFFMFPVLLMGTNNLHGPLTKLVHSLSLLLGRVVSERTRRNKGWKTCFHHVSQRDIRLSEQLIPESMCEYEYETAPSCLRSHMHQIVHYPDCVQKFGSLNGCWMFGDERRNKVVKNMSNQRKHCEPSIARVYSERVRGEEPIRCPPPISLETRCVYKRHSKPYRENDPVLSVRLRSITRSKYGMELPTEL